MNILSFFHYLRVSFQSLPRYRIQTTPLLLHRHAHIRLLRNRIRTRPHRRNSLELRVEVNSWLAVEGAGTTTRDTLLVAGEGEHGKRDGDRHVDTDLTGLDVATEGLGGRTGTGEDGGTVAVFVCVDEVD